MPALDDQSLYEVLSGTLLSGRLGAGTKLGEQRLAAIFGVSRERVRKVLHRLGHERLIEMFPNRGAYVGNPSLQDARQIYDARRIVEGGIAWRVAESLTREQRSQLRRHSEREEHAHDHANRAESIRLSGKFHILLASMTGNDFVMRQMQELVSRTSMLVALFEDDSAAGCSVHEHQDILSALESHDPAGAARAMTAHLSLIETRLRPRTKALRESDLEAIFGEAIASHTGAVKARVRAN
jgi:DNA-binding GntR family transcriptional regulator